MPLPEPDPAQLPQTYARAASRRRQLAIGALATRVLAATALLAVACEPGPKHDEKAAIDGGITVFAASSLTDAFSEIGRQFQADYPGTRVAFGFGSSSALAAQLNEGAPVDVFASANSAQMKVATDRGNATDPIPFATNTLVVVVASDNRSVQSYGDLAKPGLTLVLASRDVPVVLHARESLAAATAGNELGPAFATRVLANLKSDEASARAVLTKVQLGEADAGIVYRTDVGTAAADVRQVEIPAKYNVVAEYPVAVATRTRRPALARAFVDYLLSEKGQAIIQEYGFGLAMQR